MILSKGFHGIHGGLENIVVWVGDLVKAKSRNLFMWCEEKKVKKKKDQKYSFLVSNETRKSAQSGLLAA